MQAQNSFKNHTNNSYSILNALASWIYWAQTNMGSNILGILDAEELENHEFSKNALFLHFNSFPSISKWTLRLKYMVPTISKTMIPDFQCSILILGEKVLITSRFLYGFWRCYIHSIVGFIASHRLYMSLAICQVSMCLIEADLKQPVHTDIYHCCISNYGAS